MALRTWARSSGRPRRRSRPLFVVPAWRRWAELGVAGALPTLSSLLEEQDRRLAELSAEALRADRAVGARSEPSTAARGIGPRASVARGALDMARLRGVLLAEPA